MLRRLAALSSKNVVSIAATWPLVWLVVAVVEVASALRPVLRGGGVAAVRFGGSWFFFGFLLLPPIAFVAIAAIARRRQPSAH